MDNFGRIVAFERLDEFTIPATIWIRLLAALKSWDVTLLKTVFKYLLGVNISSVYDAQDFAVVGSELWR